MKKQAKKVYFVAVKTETRNEHSAEIYVFESLEQAESAMFAFASMGYDTAISELRGGMQGRKLTKKQKAKRDKL